MYTTFASQNSRLILMQKLDLRNANLSSIFRSSDFKLAARPATYLIFFWIEIYNFISFSISIQKQDKILTFFVLFQCLTLDEFDAHLNSAHPRLEAFKCLKCPSFKGQTYADLQAHEQEVHFVVKDENANANVALKLTKASVHA